MDSLTYFRSRLYNKGAICFGFVDRNYVEPDKNNYSTLFQRFYETPKELHYPVHVGHGEDRRRT